MPTQQEYSERLLALLSERLIPFLRDIDPEAVFSLEEFSDKLGGILEELESQHTGASTHVQSLVSGQVIEPWDGHGELAFVLYYLHNTPAELRDEIDSQPLLKLIWDVMDEVAAPSLFTPDSFNSLIAELLTGNRVHCNKWGDIYGIGQYEQLDPRWAWTLKNDLMNHLPDWLCDGCGVADFVSHDWSHPVKMNGVKNGEVRIAIIGDWGSGKYKLNGLDNKNGPAIAVMETLKSLSEPPDYLIHLGDTYYSGTGPERSPVNEETINLVDVLELYPELAKPGRCFTLNSNHEMYGGARGYYGSALTHTLFSSHQGCSYFALEFEDWVLAGIDSGYFDPSALYMQGGLGNEKDDPQYDFLRKVKSWDKNVILMSHHTGLSTDGSKPSKYLWNDVNSVLSPDYWYWGHTHLGIAYSDMAYSGNMKSRCIGHSSMPFAVPPGMKNCKKNVDWYSDTPLGEVDDAEAILYTSPRAKNGFVMLTLKKGSITEEVYEIGNTNPVWKK